MPRGRSVKKKKRIIKMDEFSTFKTPDDVSENYLQGKSTRNSYLTKKNIILLVILLLIILVWKFKGYFVAALVNGQPISRFELNDRMTRQFGDQTLDNIINERLILSAARQKGVFITSDEIKTREKQIEGRLDGKMSLSEALSAQGMTEDMFKKQLEVQISLEKLFGKEATVSAKEIDDYISKNSQDYKSATDPAAVQEEVKSILVQQKSSELFDNWFSDIRKNADIKKFL